MAVDEYAGIRAEARNTLAEQMRIDHERARVPNDGKLRIAPLKACSMQVGHSFLAFGKGRIIDDPAIIRLIEGSDIPFEIITAPAPPRRARKEPAAAAKE